MRIAGWIVATGLLLIPAQSFAMQEARYEFQTGAVNAKWEGKGPVKMQRHDQGIILSTENDTGAILTAEQPNFFADRAEITLSSEHPVTVFLGWVMESDPDHKTYAISVELEGGANAKGVAHLHRHSFWMKGDKQMGLILPPHTTILLQNITLQHWNVLEKFLNGLLSFWVMDGYRPYAINFLWGPQYEPIAADWSQIYYSQPPLTISWTMILYVIIVLSIGSILFLGSKQKKSRTWIIQRILSLFVVCWVLLDLHMGAEFLSWVIHDASTYGTVTAGERTLRDRDAFYDFADFATPLVADRKSYIFLGTFPWPYLGNMRYITYPSLPGIAYDTDDTWVIYRRPDVRISSDMRLLVDGAAVAGPGTVLGIFDETSFVYRVSPASPPAKK